jgi:RNA polymerase sigma-70 factor (ECF subfamily)
MATQALSVSTPPASATGRDTLVQRCAEGDARAFEELYNEYKGMVARLARNVAGQRNDLDDIVQEVFLQVHKSIASFQGTSKFTTWLYRLTINVSLQYVKAKKHRAVPYLAIETRRDLAADEPSPERQVWSQERWQILMSILETLSEKKRIVFMLHEIEGVEAKEIGAILGIPTLTVRTRLFYARKAIYDRLAKNPELLAGMRGGGIQ